MKRNMMHSGVLFDEFQRVRKYKKLSSIFDISSHLNPQLRRKWRNKIIKIYSNKDHTVVVTFCFFFKADSAQSSSKK